MSSNGNGKLGFGNFKVDPFTQILWHKDDPVELPPKAVGLLCLLVERRGDVVTKDEIWKHVWNDAFVEETNLTHNIYLLRKTFRELGAGELIKTVPRRGYRFTGEVSATNGRTFLYERATITDTLIEEETISEGKSPIVSNFSKLLFVAAALVIVGFAAAFAAWWKEITPFSGPDERIRSLAVLPFQQLDRSSESDRQGVVLADTLITQLSRLKSVRISSITAVSDLDDPDPIAAGKLLDVEAVLAGTIYRTGDRTHIRVRLVKVNDGTAIWAGDFERIAEKEVRFEGDIAEQVTNALVPHLESAERSALAKSYTAEPDAFRLYQEARFEWNKRNTQGATEAARLFRQAIAKDPGFALAYAGLAEVAATMNPEEAEVIAARALEIDPDLAEAHAALGFINTFAHRNWVDAEKELTRSIELNPNYARARHWYAELLAILGRNAEAKDEMERALALDPRSHNFLADLGQIYYFNGEYREAEAYCRRALELDPDFAFAHEYLSDINLQTGEFEKAVDARLAAERAHARFSLDSIERTRKMEETLERRRILALQRGRNAFVNSLLSGSDDPVAAYYDARRYAALGDKKTALLSLERSIESKAFHTVFIKADPVFADLRNEPRFVAILRKMKLAN